MKNLILYLLILLSINVTAQVNLSNGLMAHYPFTGNAGDSSGNNNHGTVHNATLTMDRFGNPNSAYLFNGSSSYIHVPYSPSLQTSTYELTLCAWVKINDWTGAPNKEAMILDKSDGNPGSWHLEYKDHDPNPAVEVLHFRADAANYSIPTYNTFPDTGRWYFLAVAIATDSFKENNFYIDCSKDIVVTGFPSSFWTNNSDLYIGKSGNANDTHFNGVIDDIRIYNRSNYTALLSFLERKGSFPKHGIS